MNRNNIFNKCTKKIRERIAFWEHEYCNRAVFDQNTDGCVCVLVELCGIIGETWTSEGIFDRDRARKVTK